MRATSRRAQLQREFRYKFAAGSSRWEAWPACSVCNRPKRSRQRAGGFVLESDDDAGGPGGRGAREREPGDRGRACINMNNEKQTILLRGVVRPADIGPSNTVASNTIGGLELEIKGKGVISDGVRPPHPILRAILRILNF